MSKFGNKKKESFLSTMATSSLCDDNCSIVTKAKFNFKYFNCDQKPYSTCIEELNEKEKIDFFTKLKEYSKESLAHWQRTGIGKNRYSVLEVYGKFPNKSNFKHLPFVPHDVLWARFRMNQDARIIGFICPENVMCENGKNCEFDTNTFYVVFIDLNHNFYSLK
ncbi:MAG: hypothetical protein V4604_10265 [Bacteroidota bacterium]